MTISDDDDATLSVLALEDGNGDAVALTPQFASDTTSYTADVLFAVDELTIVVGDQRG